MTSTTFVHTITIEKKPTVLRFEFNSTDTIIVKALNNNELDPFEIVKNEKGWQLSENASPKLKKVEKLLLASVPSVN